jgi:uncharacterized membrane protein
MEIIMYALWAVAIGLIGTFIYMIKNHLKLDVQKSEIEQIPIYR